MLLDQGRRAEGRRKLEVLLAEQPDFLPALETLGEIYLAEQQLDCARERLEHAVRLGSRRAQTCYLAGLVRLHHGRDERGAEPFLARAVELAPGHADYLAAWELARKTMEEREGAELRARALEATSRPTPALPHLLVSGPPAMPTTAARARPQLQRLFGTLTRVDCLGPVARLGVLSHRGPVRLLIRGPYSLRLGSPRRLSCGPQMKPVRLAYWPLRDPYFQTLGDVRTLDY